MTGVAQEVGQVFYGAIKKHTSDWDKAAMLCGASDGVEFMSESLTRDQQLIANKQMLGAGFELPGVAGNRKAGGSTEHGLYYADPVMECVIGAFAADTVSNPTAGVYVHTGAIQRAALDHFFTVLAAGSLFVKELNTAKIGGITLTGDCEGDGQWVKCKIDWLGADLHKNVGAISAAYFVASVTVADGARIMANTQYLADDGTPQPFLISVTPTSTGSPVLSESIQTIVCIDEYGKVHSLVYTQSTDLFSLDGATGVAPDANDAFTGMHFVTVVSVTSSGTVGVGTLVVGRKPGVNTVATAASITTESTREEVLTTDMHAYASLQSAGAFAAAHELDISGFELSINRSMDDRHTTLSGRKRAQPTVGGSGYPTVGLKLKFSSLSAREVPRLFDDDGRQLKAVLDIIGPRIGATVYNYRLRFFFNVLQCMGDPNVGGAGLISWDWGGNAHGALTAPTGVFPAAMVAPIGFELTTSVSTDFV